MARPQVVAGWSASALACLAIVARTQGLDLQDDALEPGAPDQEGRFAVPALRRAARRAGLGLRANALSFDALARSSGAAGTVVRMRDGSAMVLRRIDRSAAGTAILLEDPDAGRDALLLLDRRRFEQAWTGEVLRVRRLARLDDDTMPFGFRRIAGLMLADRRLVGEILASAFAISLITLAPIVFLRLLTVRVLQYRSLDTLEVLSAIMLALIAVETGLGAARRIMADRLAARVDTRLWMSTFARLLKLPIDHFETVPSGLTIYRVNLLSKVRSLLLTQIFALALDAGVLGVFIPVMLVISVPLTLVVLAVFALIVGWIVVMMPGYRVLSATAERAEANRGAFLFQTISGIRTVKTLALDARQRAQWMGLTDHTDTLRVAAASRGTLIQSVVTVLERLLIVGSMAGGAFLALRSDDPVSLTTLFAFVLLAQRVVSPLQQVAQLIQQFDEARTAVEDLGALVNQPLEEGRSGYGIRSPLRGQVVFSNLRFTYRGAAAPALRDVNFEIPAGAVFGIMGRSGSGKTTVTRLLQRLHADYAGSIRIDGVDVREYDVDHLRASLGVVLQDNFLFAGTIAQNIAVAKSDAGPDEIVRAARLAGAEEFIDKLPGGYETAIYEGSPNLSGGQRQRIAIARALITDPRILILDEATSALDADSEAIVNANLRRIAAGRTTIVISHRLSSLVLCDAILVLDGGEVRDIGRHADLLQRSDIYSGLWARQTAHVADEETPSAPRPARVVESA